MKKIIQFLKNLSCKIGWHFYIRTVVKSKLNLNYPYSYDEYKTKDDLTWKSGRCCLNCEKEQVEVLVWTKLEYYDVIK